MIARLLATLSPGALTAGLLAMLIPAALGGAMVAGWRADAEIALLREAAARSEARIAEHASRQLLEAQQRGDALSRKLASANRAAARLKKERSDAIAQITTGRLCLDGRALGLLDGAPGVRVELPAPADDAAGAYAGRVATDADVGRWALDSGERYVECKARLDALIDWHTTGAP